MPKVTVFVPSYNHKNMITDCLDSIAAQSYHDFEWIVIDDASTDGSQNFLKQVQKKYGFNLILHNQNKGVSETINEALSIATGEFFSVCASDDYWVIDKLQIQVDYMESHPNCAMCYGKTYKVDRNNVFYGEKDSSHYKDGSVFNDIICLKFHPPVNYMYRTKLLRSLGGYPKGVVAEDFYMNCLISDHYNIGYIPKPLGYYRIAPLEVRRDPLSLIESHENTINMYKEREIFKTAIALHYCRSFYTLSNYSKYKFLSIKYFFKIRDFEIIRPVLLRGLRNLFFVWKKC